MGGGELPKSSRRLRVRIAALQSRSGHEAKKCYGIRRPLDFSAKLRLWRTAERWPIHAGGERVGTLLLPDCKRASPTPACVVGSLFEKVEQRVCRVDLRHVQRRPAKPHENTNDRFSIRRDDTERL